jgi:hypothetical protein
MQCHRFCIASKPGYHQQVAEHEGCASSLSLPLSSICTMILNMPTPKYSTILISSIFSKLIMSSFANFTLKSQILITVQTGIKSNGTYCMTVNNIS